MYGLHINAYTMSKLMSSCCRAL